MSEIKLSNKFFIMSFLNNKKGISGHLDNLQYIKDKFELSDNLKEKEDAYYTIRFLSEFLEEFIPLEEEYELGLEKENERIKNDPEYRQRIFDLSK